MGKTKTKHIPSLTDLDDLEHAMVQVSKIVRRIVEDCPKLYKVDPEDVKDELVKQKLTSRRIAFAQKLKKLHKDGKLPLFDALINLEKQEDLGVTADQVKALTLELAPQLGVGNARSIKSASSTTSGSLKSNLGNSSEEEEEEDWPPRLPKIHAKALEKQVFTHKSMADLKSHFLNKTELLHQHNERLEFIGDAVLNFTITDLLYREFPNADEGKLTIMRSKIVRNDTLWDWARIYRFDERLIIQENQKDQLHDQEKKSKIIADTVEAYIGGLCADSVDGFSKAQRWVIALARPMLKTIHDDRDDSVNINAKNQLYVKVGTKDMKPVYVTTVVGEGDIPFSVECRIGDDVLGVGHGKNQKIAGNRAAMAALENTDMVEYYAQVRRSMPKEAPNTLVEYDATNKKHSSYPGHPGYPGYYGPVSPHSHYQHYQQPYAVVNHQQQFFSSYNTHGVYQGFEPAYEWQYEEEYPELGEAYGPAEE